MSTYFHTKLFGLVNFFVTPRRVLFFYLEKIISRRFYFAPVLIGAK